MIYNILSQSELKIGYSGERGWNTITFKGFTPFSADDTVYFCVAGLSPEPLVDMSCIINSKFTTESGTRKAQLIEKNSEGTIVKKSSIFTIDVLDAIDLDGEDPLDEITALWYETIDEKLKENADAVANLTVDSELDATSENPVQNKAVADALGTKVGYAEYTDSYLYLYSDSTKGTLVAKLLIEGGSSTGGISEAKCKQIIEGYGFTVDSSLATVSKTGSYNDLSDKPTIPSVTDEEKATWNGKQDALTDEDKQAIADMHEDKVTSVNGLTGDVTVDVSGKLDKPTEDGTSGQVLGLDDDLVPKWISQSSGGDETWETIVDIDEEGFPETASIVNDILGDFKVSEWKKIFLHYYMPSGDNGKQAIMASTYTNKESRMPVVLGSTVNTSYTHAIGTLELFGDRYISQGNAYISDNSMGPSAVDNGYISCAYADVKAQDDSGATYSFVDWGSRASKGSTLKMMGVRL